MHRAILRRGLAAAGKVRWCGEGAATVSKVAGFKKAVEAQEDIAFKEVSNYGKLFTVKDLPPKTNKGNVYAVFEVRSKMSAHLLRVLASVVADWGGFPGVFTRDRSSGKPKNIRFADAVKDHRCMEDIWLMLFIRKDDEEKFLEKLKELLLDAQTLNGRELGVT
eukprot:TRINITY_DN2854_c0_g1_i2.p1 TRINITY_DN2854_c0_g1~~TRINITY_DN2854_c0_g1_i2.p1  ORF type:complete len:177 (+),score=19.03 TRINITY_DN2854_c0_g1_i2:40-531(+)